MIRLRFSRSSHGFSLVEVAIAVVVIGLVTSFALKGREMIHTSKLRAVVEQVNAFKIATQAFVDKYGYLPGCLPNATDVLGVENGDGSGKIESLDDSKRFWKQLSVADVINIDISTGNPVSKLGGYFTVSSAIDSHPGVWIILSAGTTDNKNFLGIVSPEDAYLIDKQGDTGNPNGGDVQVLKASGASGECIVDGKYNFKNKSKDCAVIFKLW